jgi:putative transposase
MAKFFGPYRGQTTRLQNWNYAWQGWYFITICTQDRVNYFGEIVDGEMYYTAIGFVAIAEWLKSPELRPDMNLTLDVFQVMPNHFHGIIRIGTNIFNGLKPDWNAFTTEKEKQSYLAARAAATHGGNCFGPQRKNLASVIRGFKGGVKRYCNKNNIPFQWQGSYHDWLLRSRSSLEKVRKYIRNNVRNWKRDRYGN